MTTKSTFRATYRDRNRLIFRDFIACTFLEAVEYAADAREDGESLINVRSADLSEPVITGNLT